MIIRLKNANLKKIAFCGSDAIAIPILNHLFRLPEIALVGVLSQPDRRSGRGRKLQANPIKSWATDLGVEVKTPAKPGAQEIEWLEEQKVDLTLTMAYGHILSQGFLDSAKNGCYNLHASLPIVGQQLLPIDKDDTGASLREKLAKISVPLLDRYLTNLLDGDAPEKIQDSNQVSYCRKLCKEDAYLEFSLTAEQLEWRTRAFKAWPGSVFFYEGIPLRVGECAIESEINKKPGEILVKDSKLFVGTGKGALDITQLQKPGGKMLHISEFLRGFSIKQGYQITFPPSLPLVSKKFR